MRRNNFFHALSFSLLTIAYYLYALGKQLPELTESNFQLIGEMEEIANNKCPPNSMVQRTLIKNDNLIVLLHLVIQWPLLTRGMVPFSFLSTEGGGKGRNR